MSPPTPPHLGQALRRTLDAREITIEQASDRLKISRAAVRRLLAAADWPSASIAAVTRDLDIPIDALIPGIGACGRPPRQRVQPLPQKIQDTISELIQGGAKPGAIIAAIPALRALPGKRAYYVIARETKILAWRWRVPGGRRGWIRARNKNIHYGIICGMRVKDILRWRPEYFEEMKGRTPNTLVAGIKSRIQDRIGGRPTFIGWRLLPPPVAAYVRAARAITVPAASPSPSAPGQIARPPSRPARRPAGSRP